MDLWEFCPKTQKTTPLITMNTSLVATKSAAEAGIAALPENAASTTFGPLNWKQPALPT